MTAPRTGSGGGIQGMIQTIVALQRLRLEQDAQKLQEQQLGLQQNAAPLNSFAALQGVLGHMKDPNTFLPYASQFSQQSGMPLASIENLIRQTPPWTETTRAGAVQRGVAGAGGSLDYPAATAGLAQQSPEEVTKGKLLNTIFSQTGDYYSNLTPEEQQGFQKGVLQRTTTGETVQDAAMGEAVTGFMGRANKETKDQIVAIGKGLVPNASEDAQQRLGWANYRLNQRNIETSLALEDLKTKAALQNAQKSMDAAAFKEADDLIEHRSNLLSAMVKNSSTITPEGIRTYAQQLNAFNAQLRQLAPQIYGPQGISKLDDIPVDKQLSVSSIWGYISGRIQNP